jgi:hypothetical protein
VEKPSCNGRDPETSGAATRGRDFITYKLFDCIESNGCMRKIFYGSKKEWGSGVILFGNYKPLSGTKPETTTCAKVTL